MRNIALIIMLFVLNGCSFNQLFLSEEVDKVTVVKYTPYVKHHRAYFTRTHLKFIKGKQKYYFLYHPKNQHLAVLLHKKNTYELHNFTKTDVPVIKSNGKQSLRTTLKFFKHKGYVRKNLKALGYEPTIALRRYKGVKTIMIEVKDYRALQRVYKKGIQNYNAQKILSIKSVLPKNLIYPYYETYRKRAKNGYQLKQLQMIADKVGFNSNIPKPKITKIAKIKKVHKPNKEKIQKPQPEIEPKEETKLPAPQPVLEEKKPEKIYTAPKKVVKGYKYYRYHASGNELQRYLAKPETRSSLSYTQYKKLEQYSKKLHEEKLLSQGSLEELIEAYKKDKNEKYKQRILLLMKEKSEQ